ncbi:MAG: Flp pilus assembly complex ATPase component TadA [Clostridia bacterium]|nr:Flp pilus assembly complex ATPase component TadA [Clostridia bacterium]
MLQEILPPDLYNIISKSFNLDFIFEIRIRVNKPIVINHSGVLKYLKNKEDNSLVCATKSDIEKIIASTTQSSLYAFMNEIKQGFITAKGGIRIGISGEVVYAENQQVQTIKNISSLNIRIPHEIKNCAHTALCYILNGGINSTLILSAPGAGKTTFLKDICANISSENRIYQTLICDERYEIASSHLGNVVNNVGLCTDVISGATKEFAFNFGIRTMKPDVIICDEIMNMQDAEAIKKAINSGVSVIATAHASSLTDAKSRKELKFLIDNKLFKRIIVLSARNGPGTYEGIYNENLNSIYKIGE